MPHEWHRALCTHKDVVDLCVNEVKKKPGRGDTIRTCDLPDSASLHYPRLARRDLRLPPHGEICGFNRTILSLRMTLGVPDCARQLRDH